MNPLASTLIAVCLAMTLSAQVPNTLLHSIPAPFGSAQSHAVLGSSVAVDGGYTVAGVSSDDHGGVDSGVVKVFDSTTGVLLFLLLNPSPAEFGYFGSSVAISGTRLVVGVMGDDTGTTSAGRAYVYDLSSGTPDVPVVTLNNPSPAFQDFFGISVAISGMRVVVGANQDDAGTINAGSAYVYDLSGGTPTVPVTTLNNPGPGLGDQFGHAMAISGNLIVVGVLYDDMGATDAGSAYVYDLNSTTPTVPVATLNNPSPVARDHFGDSVAISGTRVVVGSPYDYTGGAYAGSAYVYDLSSGTPTVPVATLNNPILAADDLFGSSVAISGMWVVIGAPYDDTGANDAGSAYVYDLSSGTPTVPVATLNNPGPAYQDFFGTSVAICGTRAVVGTIGDDTGAYNAGSAYVYELSSSTPTAPVATLNNPGPALGDSFGSSLAVSGTLMVVGAHQDDTGANDTGSAYVYDLSSGTPTVPVATLNNPSPAMGDQFGNSVAISGNLIVVGVRYDDTGAAEAGSAYVYDLSGGTPTVPVATLNNPSPAVNDRFGYAVAISGTRVVVGAVLGNYAGSVYVYDMSSATPTVPVTTLNNPGPTVGDWFGNSVAIFGTRVVVGAFLDDTGETDAGSAYVYDLSSGTASVPITTLSNPSPVVSHLFGRSVAIFGTRVVVGAIGDDKGAPDTGRAYVYELSSGTPTLPVATLNSPSQKAYDNFGESVAISGTRVVVGAYWDDTGANNAGIAYVYDLSSGTPTFPLATLNNPGPAVNDWFGLAVAIDGTTVAIGTPNDDTVMLDKGYTYVFGPGPVSPGIAKAQTLVFTAPLKLYQAESPFTLSASTNSGLPVVYTVVSGPATVLGNVLTLTGTGTVKVSANQPGNAGYLAATSVERTITVAANPTALTLTNLSQTYTATPRPITLLGATGAVNVTYKVGLSYVPEAPINVGSYAVKAVAGAITKTGTLVISKAPLFVTPNDQRKFAGQVNPLLGFVYSGFLGSDYTLNSVSKAPVIATTATATSVGGNYPITASGGTSANYLFVYMKGAMKVETFAASYEALLVDAGRPAAKLELTVAASSKTFTGKLTTPTETAAVALNGTLTTNTLNETATGTATVKKGANTYLVTVTLPLTGDFTAVAKRNGVTMGTTTNGRKLLTLIAGQTLSYIGTHSALLAPATAGTGVPAGAGWAVATIDAKGLLKLTGKLADGTGLTASLAADVSSHPGYRLFIQPYTPARTGAFIAGAFTLKPQLDPGLTGRRYVAFEDAADLTWEKAPRLLDTSYRAGFGPVNTRFTLDPWLPPTPAKGIIPAITLALRLGLSAPANQFMVQHSTISSASFIDLPATLGLNAATNAVSIIAPATTPANITKWKVALTPATGAFVGSFELNDDGKKRPVPFTGIMRQPPSTDLSGLIGDGNFQLPSLTPAPNNEILSGEIGFEK